MAGKFTKTIYGKLIATIVLALVLYLATVNIFFRILFHEPSKEFDKATWKADTVKRYQMADNIINEKILISKDSSQVKELLGIPAWKNDSLQTWIYDMGMGGGGLGFLFHQLKVEFSDNKVIHVIHGKIMD